VCGQLHSPAALPPEKELKVFFGQGAGWEPAPVWVLCRREKNPFTYRELNPGCPARSLVNVLTDQTGSFVARGM